MASVLVVEDHEVLAQSLIRLLTQRGKHEVTAVSSAEQALEQLGSDHFDVALLDVSLPGMNGIDLVGRIHDARPDLPCLMVSGYMAPHYVQLSMEAGARGYVLKEDITGILNAIPAVLKGGTFVSRALRAH